MRVAVGMEKRDTATVATVCFDAEGCLVAGAVIGGVRASPPGRMGASSLIGAGTWADSRVAVFRAGDLRPFIRSGPPATSRRPAEYGMSLEQAGMPPRRRRPKSRTGRSRRQRLAVPRRASRVSASPRR